MPFGATPSPRHLNPTINCACSRHRRWPRVPRRLCPSLLLCQLQRDELWNFSFSNVSAPFRNQSAGYRTRSESVSRALGLPPRSRAAGLIVSVFYPSISFARSCHRRWSGCSPDFCFCVLHAHPPLPHPECGLQDTCISINTRLGGSRPTSSLTRSGKDVHRTNHEQREREQPGRFGARGSAGLASVN